jgi:hypothetical protein
MDWHNSTSMVSTNITLTDPQHAHSYNVPNPQQPALGTPGSVGVGTVGAITGLNSTGITLNDPTHSHVLNPAGGDKAHNNVQPTIGMGNMFIYSGKVNLGSFPYTTGTLLF